MTVLIVLLVASVFIAGTLWLVLKNKTTYENNSTSLQTKNINIKGRDFKLEIADTPNLREKGLMNREKMELDHGMLFIFDSDGLYPFWMKNTLISLDIIWINSEKEVVSIYENAKPCGNVIDALCSIHFSTKKSRYVIELNSGMIKDLDIKVVDKIEF